MGSTIRNSFSNIGLAAIGLRGSHNIEVVDARQDVDGSGSALLSSQNTLSVSSKVLSPGDMLLRGSLFLEPMTGVLTLLVLLRAACRRGGV